MDGNGYEPGTGPFCATPKEEPKKDEPIGYCPTCGKPMTLAEGP